MVNSLEATTWMDSIVKPAALRFVNVTVVICGFPICVVSKMIGLGFASSRALFIDWLLLRLVVGSEEPQPVNNTLSKINELKRTCTWILRLRTNSLNALVGRVVTLLLLECLNKW